MTPVLVGLLLAIALALAVVGVVAYPHLREGARLLTPEGERLARGARQKAQALAGSAADALINREKPAVADDGADDAGPATRRGVRPGPAVAPPSVSAPAPAVSSVLGPPPAAAPGQPTYVQPGHGQPGHGQPGPGQPGQPGHGQPGASASEGDLSRLADTQLVWASPPPQLRPDGATPPPGTTRVGDRGQDPRRPPLR